MGGYIGAGRQSRCGGATTQLGRDYMTTENNDTTAESTRGPVDGWPSFERRPLLKALGVGATLAAGGGVAAGSGAESDSEENDDLIDPVYGYPTADPESVPSEVQPDHEVELHSEFPEDFENPDRPSLFHFEPSGLEIEAGDVVQFTFTNPNHTITAYHPQHGWQQRVPEGTPPFSSPVVQQDGAWFYRFEREGLYDIYCGAHSVFGMAMRLVVGDMDEDSVPAYEDTFEAEPPLFPPLAPEFLSIELNAVSEQNEDCEWVWPTDRLVLDTDVLDPMNIQDEGAVSFGAVADELGLDFEPEHEE